MGKVFNVTGDCRPDIHYMVDISGKLRQIKAMVDAGQYFTINRARQYGKTTTLRALEKALSGEYYVASLDFQYQMSNAKFRSEHAFSAAFARAFLSAMEEAGDNLPDKMNTELNLLRDRVAECREETDLVELFRHLSAVCGGADKPVVLMIDEVDSAANNQIFLDFLAQLRGYYLRRDRLPAFQSVILAGVYDVKNMKRKIRPEEEHMTNSPWNIAADFDVVMSFSCQEIGGMLAEYEQDWHTGMDAAEMAGLLDDYTSGYPYLVSRLCKLIDEKVAGGPDFPDKSAAWTRSGFLEAVRLLLSEKNTLFESLIGKLKDYPELQKVIYNTLFGGVKIVYNPDDSAVDMASMFGFVKNEGGILAIANRIFEIRLYNYFLTASEAQDSEIFMAAANDKPQFIRNGHLNMELVMEKFVQHFDSIYGDQKQEFDEEEGRRRFLLYLRPIINGVGNYYIESQTRNARRMDVVVDYLGERFVIELKIWRGDAYNKRGEEQLADYLDYFHLTKGYMLSYNFNQKKEIGVKRIALGNRVLVEAVV